MAQPGVCLVCGNAGIVLKRPNGSDLKEHRRMESSKSTAHPAIRSEEASNGSAELVCLRHLFPVGENEGRVTGYPEMESAHLAAWVPTTG